MIHGRPVVPFVLATVLGLAIVFPAIAEEEPTRTIQSEGLSFQVPSSWKSLPPRSSMRKAQLEVGPAKGDSEPAELALFVFPGGAGTAKANVDRWQQQFKTADGKTPPVESKAVKGQNVEVTRVEVAGTYSDPFASAGPRPHFRLLGAIVVTDGASYFFKMVGPDKTVLEAEPGFDTLIASIKLQGK